MTTSKPHVAQTEAELVRRYFERWYPDRSGRLSKLLFHKGESVRSALLRRWLRALTPDTLLDVGCGDGLFLRSILPHTPRLIHLEDLIARNVEAARRSLEGRAKTVEVSVADSRYALDRQRYDVVLVIGVSDYIRDWRVFMLSLARRTCGHLIIDFPKAGTVHERARRTWLALHGIWLHSTTPGELRALVTAIAFPHTMEELDTSWMMRIDCGRRSRLGVKRGSQSAIGAREMDEERPPKRRSVDHQEVRS